MNPERAALLRGFLLGAVIVAFAASCQRFLAEDPHRNWPIEYSHSDVLCEGCHPADQGIGPVSNKCHDCHLDVSPEGHYTTGCGDCHLATTWQDSSVYHGFLLLENAHALDCSACHEAADYKDLPGQSQRCASCHKPDRPKEHWTNDCGDCHIPTTWLDPSAYHDFLPLENAHDLACESCHDTDDYSTLDGFSDACESCHEEVRPQGHFRPTMCGYSTDCMACHESTTWSGGELPNHRDCTTFPKGHETANSCDDCHLAAPNYSTFSCLHCHAHRQSEMDSEHSGETDNYRYESAACLDCHPKGDD